MVCVGGLNPKLLPLSPSAVTAERGKGGDEPKDEGCQGEVGLGGVGAGDGRDDHEQKPHLRHRCRRWVHVAKRWWCLLQGTLAEIRTEQGRDKGGRGM